MVDLQPGDVLSYSAGSTQVGPSGFRKLVPGRRTMLEALGERWPDLLTALGSRPVLFINAYPATIGTFTPGITVDTYLSPRVFSRALKLGKVADHPVILLGQPLFVADAFLRHVRSGWSLPRVLMLWCGGYVMPHSLERMLEALLGPHVETLLIVQYFGAAEVDAGCLMARRRTAEGEPIYYPRQDVEPGLDGEHLLLTLRSRDGKALVESFKTGDLARRCGDGWLIRNPRRLHPGVEAAMESWSGADWHRRTGYLRRDGETIWVQLREGETGLEDAELEHFDFARRFSSSWLQKPHWR